MEKLGPFIEQYPVSILIAEGHVVNIVFRECDRSRLDDGYVWWIQKYVSVSMVGVGVHE
jgi:hypothetical protein